MNNHAGSRLSRGKRLRIAGAGFVLVLFVTGVVVGGSGPEQGKARCDDDRPCGNPPVLAEPLQNQTRWTAQAGVMLDYDADQWTVSVDEDNTLQLTSKLIGLVLVTEVERSDDDADQLLEQRRDGLGERVLGLEDDPDEENRIFGPAIGYVDGAGEALVGALDTPQGVQEQLKFAVLAATQKGVAVKLTLLTDEENPERRRQIYNLADNVINTVTWR